MYNLGRPRASNFKFSTWYC